MTGRSSSLAAASPASCHGRKRESCVLRDLPPTSVLTRSRLLLSCAFPSAVQTLILSIFCLSDDAPAHCCCCLLATTTLRLFAAPLHLLLHHLLLFPLHATSPPSPPPPPRLLLGIAVVVLTLHHARFCRDRLAVETWRRRPNSFPGNACITWPKGARKLRFPATKRKTP